MAALASAQGATVIPLGEFVATPGTLYSIHGNLATSGKAAGKPVAFIVRWVDAQGGDATGTAIALGFSDPTLRQSAVIGGDGKAEIKLTGAAANAAIKKGVLEMVVPACDQGDSYNMRDVTVEEGDGLSSKQRSKSPESESGTLRPRDESFSFSENLILNPSFEEGSGDLADGWKYKGTGTPHMEDGGYAGKRCLLLKKDNEGGRWESSIAPITPGLPIWLSYWTRFSEFADPHGHPSPIQFEFLRKAENGDFVPVPIPSSQTLFEFKTGKYYSFFGRWFPIVIGGVVPPVGATHVRALSQYLDSFQSWHSEPFVAKWGDIEIDNIALWQAENAQGGSAQQTASPYGPFLQEARLKLPPFVPVGPNCENSVSLFAVRTPEANLLFVEEMPVPVVKLLVGNLLPCQRQIALSFDVLDWEGKVVSKLTTQVDLAPYASTETSLRVDSISRLGAYYVEVQATENGKRSGEGSMRFAWLHRPARDETMRHNVSYPFDIHPAAIHADSESLTDPNEIDLQFSALKRLGVRGIRLQSRYDGLDLQNSEASIAAAQKKVENWRQTALPAMVKYDIEGWVSLMEQKRGMVPKTESELKIWRQYHVAQAAAFGNDIKFYLFGNEGVGGHTPEDLDKDCWKISGFDGTTKDWLKMYHLAREASKEVSPNIPFGPSQASDAFAKTIKRFYRGLGAEAKFDCWGFNGYGNTAAMGAAIFQVMKEHGDTHQFGVIPEVGIDTSPKGPGRSAAERKQGTGLVHFYISTLSRAPWVKRIAYFQVQAPRGKENHALFDMDWTPRPAAAAYLVMTGQLGAGHVEKEIELPGGVVLILWRKTDDSLVGVAWSRGEGSVTLDVTGKKIAASDIFGNKTVLKPTDGTITVPLTDEPQYIVGAKTLVPSKLVEVSARNATVASDKPSTVALRIVNTGKEKQTFAIHAEAHPTVIVQPEDASVALEPKAEATKYFNVQFLKANDRVRVPINFQVTNSKGMAFPAKVSDTFACCVRATEPPAMDGSWKGWEKARVLHADQRTQVEEPAGVMWKGPEDCSAEIRTLWDEKHFYLGVRVRDDVDFADQPIQAMFKNDAIEIGFDMEYQLSAGSRIVQLVMGRADKTPGLYRHSPEPLGKVDVAPRQMTIVRDDAECTTTYQIAIPWAELGGFKPKPGKQIGFGVIVDDSDGKPPDRHFISWFGSGISNKRPQDLGDLIFVE